MIIDRHAVKFYNEIRANGARAIRELADLAEERKDTISQDGEKTARSDALRNLASELEANEFQIAVVGEFSRGKSSLINALLGRKDLLPTSIEPTTAAITLLRQGDSEFARVIYPDGTTVEPVALSDLPKYVVGEDLDGDDASVASTSHLADPTTEDELDQISFAEIGEKFVQHVQGSKGDFPSRVEVYVNSPFLKEGITLVDTPGLGSVNPEHGKATREFIHRADAVIFLVNADPVISKSEVNFLLLLKAYTDQFVFAVTKVDRFSPTDLDRSLNYSRRVIRIKAGIEEPRICPVSSQWVWEGRDEKSAEKIAKSGFPEFQESLEEYLIGERGGLLLQNTVRQAYTHLKGVRSGIEAELKHVTLTEEDFDKRVETLRKGVEAAKYVCRTLDTDIEKGVQKAYDQMSGDFDWLRLTTSLKKDLADEVECYGWGEIQRASELIPVFVKGKLDEALDELLKSLSERIAQVRKDSFDYAAETLARLGQEVGLSESASPARTDWEIAFTTSAPAFVQNLNRVGTMTLVTTLALSVAEVFFFGGIGAVAMIGGLLFGGSTTPFMLRKAKEELAKGASHSLEAMIDQLLEDMKKEIARDLGQLREEINHELSSAISHVEDTVGRLEIQKHDLEFDSEKRKAELECELQRIPDIEKRINYVRFYSGYVPGDQIRSIEDWDPAELLKGKLPEL